MRPRVDYVSMALSAALGGANVNLINYGTIEFTMAGTLPGGVTTSVMAVRIDGMNTTILGTNFRVPGE
jgi:hypothetical protein